MLKRWIAGAAAILAVAVYALNEIADAAGWYSSILYFDKVMHFLGGAFVFFAITLFLPARFLRTARYSRAALGSFSPQLLRRIVFAVIAVGALWEGYEYLVQHFTGVLLATPIDSLGDMVFDTLGAIAAATVLFFIQKRYNKMIEQ